MELICCNKTFSNAKSYSNHKRWCSGSITYKEITKYGGIHAWVRKRKRKPEYCENCNKNVPMDLANISGNYLRDINDYKYLCRSCHKKMDFTESIRAKFILNAQPRERNEGGRFI